MEERPICPKCGSNKVISKYPQWRCKNCKAAWLKELIIGKYPKILLVDIETLPMEVLVWGLYKQQISNQNVIKEWSMVSWAAKWLYDSEIMSQVVSPQDAIRRKDKSIIKGLWDLMDKADIIIAHNAVKFDVRKMNARFKMNGFGPPLPYQVIDTLRHAQKNFAFSSYSLDYLNRLLDNTGKIKTEYGLWKRCIGISCTPQRQKEALDVMVRYNRQDITALEELYVELRPWMKPHPNLGLYYDSIDTQRCTNCGDTNITWKGTYVTPMNRYRAWRCKCGAVGTDRLSELSAAERKNLLVSVPR